MPRERIAAKFKGDPSGAFVNGVPARDIMEGEFANLSEEQKAAVSASPLYDLKHDAPVEAEKSVAKVAPSQGEPPMSTGAVTVPPAAPAAKDEAKK